MGFFDRHQMCFWCDASQMSWIYERGVFLAATRVETLVTPCWSVRSSNESITCCDVAIGLCNFGGKLNTEVDKEEVAVKKKWSAL